jgi:hypothetical protein
MNKTKIATITSLMLIIIALGSVSAAIAQPRPETRAQRMVTIAENAATAVNELILTVQDNLDFLEKIQTAGLTDDFGNATLDYELAVEYVDKANMALDDLEYDQAIQNATQALTNLRQVYITIRGILAQAEVQITPIVDPESIEEAIQRTTERIQTLQDLISETNPIYQNLTNAQELLTSAQDTLLDDPEQAKEYLREANIVVTEVIQELRQVARELTRSRIEGYLEIARQYRSRIRERWQQAQSEGFSLESLFQRFGFENDEEFTQRFQEMIENAKDSEDLQQALGGLKEIGETLRNMANQFEERWSDYRAQHGIEDSMGGFGQQNDGISSNQPGFKGGQ